MLARVGNLERMGIGMSEEKGLIVTRLQSVEELEKIVPEWEELDRQVFPRMPFTSALWNMLWWRHFRADRGWSATNSMCTSCEALKDSSSPSRR